MRKLLLVGVLLLLGCAVAPYFPRVQAMELARRIPGHAQRCVPIRSTDAIHVSQNEPHTLIYGSGKTIWSNDLDYGCAFRPGDVLVIEPNGTDYCRGDIVRSVDEVTHAPGPSCVLRDFIPYTLD